MDNTSQKIMTNIHGSSNMHSQINSTLHTSKHVNPMLTQDTMTNENNSIELGIFLQNDAYIIDRDRTNCNRCDKPCKDNDEDILTPIDDNHSSYTNDSHSSEMVVQFSMKDKQCKRQQEEQTNFISLSTSRAMYQSPTVPVSKRIKINTSQYVTNVLHEHETESINGNSRSPSENMNTEHTVRDRIPKTLPIFDNSQCKRKKSFTFFSNLSFSNSSGTPSTPSANFFPFPLTQSRNVDTPSAPIPPNTPVYHTVQSKNRTNGPATTFFQKNKLNAPMSTRTIVNSHKNMKSDFYNKVGIPDYYANNTTSNHDLPASPLSTTPLQYPDAPVVRRIVSNRARLRRQAFAKSCSAPSSRTLRLIGEGLLGHTTGGSLHLSVSTDAIYVIDIYLA